MIGVILASDQTGVGQLAEYFGVAFEANRVSLDRFIQELAHERYDCARIDSSAQKRAKRNITYEVRLDTVPKQSFKLLGVAIFVPIAVSLMSKRQVPVAVNSYTACVARQSKPRRERLNPCEHRRGGGHVLQRQEIAQTVDIQASLHGSVL